MSDKEVLVRTFETYWRTIGGQELEREYRFHPTRRWRFDFCHRAAMVAIEIDGGTWKGGAGRHTSGVGFSRDCEKLNAAALLGWRVVRFTSDMLRDDPAGHLEPVRDFIRGEVWE